MHVKVGAAALTPNDHDPEDLVARALAIAAGDGELEPAGAPAASIETAAVAGSRVAA